MYISISISHIQLITLRSVLQLEIDTDGRCRAMREPALSAYKRLIAEPAGIKAGRGQKGRIEALRVVEELLTHFD